MAHIYSVEITHQGQTHTLSVPEDKQILRAATAAGLELPSSCNAGVCTTCAAKITSGQVEQTDAMGLGPELVAEGYVLLCVAYPRSDLKLISEQEDAVYQRQFGMSQS